MTRQYCSDVDNRGQNEHSYTPTDGLGEPRSRKGGKAGRIEKTVVADSTAQIRENAVHKKMNTDD